jgi:thiamine biosynthesis protein ThiS
MHLQVNGQDEEIRDGASVADLLRRFDVPAIRAAVEVNQDLVARARHDSTKLQDGDRVEIITFVGGG